MMHAAQEKLLECQECVLRLGMSNVYNEFSLFHLVCVDASEELLNYAVTVALCSKSKDEGSEKEKYLYEQSKLSILDCGSATGKNSAVLMKRLIEKINNCLSEHLRRKKKKELKPEICIYHDDVEGNDWGVFFKTILSKKDGYVYNNVFYDNRGDANWDIDCNVFSFGVCKNMYERIAPSDSLTFVTSYCSLHWVERIPVPIPNGLYEPYADDRIRKIWWEAHTESINRFLLHRSIELKKGGYILIAVPTVSKEYNQSNENAHLHSSNMAKDSRELSMWRYMETTLDIMKQRGRISEETVKSALVPICALPLEHLAAIFTKSSPSSSFKIPYEKPPQNGWSVADSFATGKLKEGECRHPEYLLVLEYAYVNTIVYGAYDTYLQIAEDAAMCKTNFSTVTDVSKGTPLGTVLPASANPLCIQIYYQECTNFLRGINEHLVRGWMRNEVKRMEKQKGRRLGEEIVQDMLDNLVDEYFDTFYTYVCFKREDGKESFLGPPPHPVKFYLPTAFLAVRKV